MNKSRMKYLLVTCMLLLCLVGCSSSSGGAKEKLIVGTEAGFAPYEYLEGDKVVGVDMDIAQAIADELGKELVIKNMDFQGALTAVQSGKVDLVAAGVSVNEERKKSMDFSEPYVDSTDVVVVNKEKSAVTGAEDLNGKVIGVQEGNIADLWVSDTANVEAKDVKRYTTFSQAAQDLSYGKIDCIVMDEKPANDLVAANSDLVILEGEENVVFSDQYAIAVQKGNSELVETINKVISDLNQSGDMENIIARHVHESSIEQGGWFAKLKDRYYSAFIAEGRYMAYLKGLWITVQISFFAILIGIVIGMLIAMIKVTVAENRKFRWLELLCNLYTTVIRGTPLIVQLLIIYNLIFTSRDTNPILVGAVCFGINSSAYVAEIVRAGIASLDKGQMEAGRSLGFNHVETMRYIIMPQAIKNILPALGNEFIVLIKETSVAGYIAVTDLTKAAQYVQARTFDPLPPLFIAAAIYLVMVLGLTKLLGCLERRMSQGDRI